MFKCIVDAVDIPTLEIDDTAYEVDSSAFDKSARHMRIKLLEKYDSDVYEHKELEKHGLKSVQGPSRVAPALLDYLHSINPDAGVAAAIADQDQKILEDFKKDPFSDTKDNFQFEGKQKQKSQAEMSKGHRIFPRDPQVSRNALSHAGYVCEIDKDHPTFIRRNSDKNYTEPHHLVPLAYSEEFPVSLDVEENVVSLCSNCHNQIHCGKGADALLEQLFILRKDDLEKVGINVSLRRLKEMYRLIQIH